jgi:hypothetical protein
VKLGQLRKAIAGVIGSVATIAATLPVPNAAKPWVAFGISVLTAIAVYLVPNDAAAAGK